MISTIYNYFTVTVKPARKLVIFTNFLDLYYLIYPPRERYERFTNISLITMKMICFLYGLYIRYPGGLDLSYLSVCTGLVYMACTISKGLA